MSDAIGSGNTFDLNKLRRTSVKFVLASMWVIALAVMIADFGISSEIHVGVGLMVLGLAGLPTLSYMATRTSHSTAIASAVGMAGLIALLVYAFRWDGEGIAYQIDMHMTFFAGLAFLTGFLNWRALVAYTGVVAFHHLGSAVFLPAIAFPDGAPYVRV